jgi:hypothetical protein
MINENDFRSLFDRQRGQDLRDDTQAGLCLVPLTLL